MFAMTNLKSRMYVSLIIAGVALIQMGCQWGESYTVCNPDQLSSDTDTQVITFNGEPVIVDTFDFDFGLDGGEITIQDETVASFVKGASITVRGIYSDDEAATQDLDDLPLHVGDKKEYSFKQDLRALYFTVHNLSTNVTQSLPPMEDHYVYNGWIDNTSAVFQPYYETEIDDQDEVYQLLLTLTDAHTADYKLEERTDEQPTQVSIFPDLSPDKNFQIDLGDLRHWEGTVSVELLQNSDNKYRIEVITKVSDGTNTLEQTLNKTYVIETAGCHEVAIY